MIYLVTTNRELFENSIYKIIGVDESLSLLSSYDILQADSETDGRDAHINRLLCFQLGTKVGGFQVVIDCTTVDIRKYKDILESKYLVFQNAKFDLQFLYNYNIVPRKIYDTMIVEQLLYLGYPSSQISYSLKAIAERRLGIDIDKTVRGEIIWRGLDDKVIQYAAGDVMYLEDIMHSQIKDCKSKDCIIGAKLECDAVPSMAYLEWCGIKLSIDKWQLKMQQDNKSLEENKKALDNFCITNPSLSKFTYIDRQGDLFNGFDLTPKCTINWSSYRQVVEVAKILGFNTTVQDKRTKEDKDSVLEKYLKGQKGINDEFLKLYFNYQEKAKVVSSFGQGHLNAINPITGRIHTVYRQLGASSGRMSCGSNQPNNDLAKYKKLKSSEVTYPNIQQLPADDITRSSFIAEKDNLFCSCDFSAMESYLGADIYDDKEFQHEFLYGSKDTHSLFAWMVFRKECEALGCKSVADVKRLAPKWRKEVKAVEFAWMFGAAAHTISQAANCSVEEAQEYINRLEKGFKGISEFAKKGSKFVRTHGYVVINKYTGHKMYWWDYKYWLKEEQSFKEHGFWDYYRECKSNHTDLDTIQRVREHFQAASKWDRMARNAPTQGKLMRPYLQ